MRKDAAVTVVQNCHHTSLIVYHLQWPFEQLVFPAYIIFLVVIVILISEFSDKFARLIGKRNPVATLATLILLSYTKLLHTIIASLSRAVLNYPDGTHQMVWLPDASVGYLSGKHIALFVTAIITLIAGVVYTTTLLLWQWLLHHQDKKFFKWTKSQKLCHFIEPYHAPYTFKHRYWTGLLLLSRVLLYIVSAINTSGDPRVTIVAVTFIVGCLLLIKGVLANKIYKNRLVDAIETVMYFNILAIAAFTWYFLGTGKSQAAIAYVSVILTFALLLAVIAFHVYKYTGLCSIIQKSQIYTQMKAKM